MTEPTSKPLGSLLSGLTDEARLSQLLGAAALSTISVRGVTDDSRQVSPGSLFIAVPGVSTDGRKFIADALQKQACAVVTEAPAESDDPRIITVPDVRQALAIIGQRWYDVQPGFGPKLIGITGTNGKSTTAYMLRAILQAVGHKVGLLGTIEYELCGEALPANLTTPGALALCQHLRTCSDNGADYVVMEVSSHALAQKRTHGLQFAAAGFTNLTQDHLDYHATLDEYAAAKAILFDELNADATAVLNVDDDYAQRMTADSPAKVLSCGLQRTADLAAQINNTCITGTKYTLKGLAGAVKIESAMVGEHNVANAVIAAGLAHAVGIAPEHIAAGLSNLVGVPGRLERVAEITGTQVFVDYAHTPDALEHVLAVLKPLTKGRLVCVFGCGGDRDRAKRPMMARAVGNHADAIVLTNDNPRTEDPQQIIQDALTGFEPHERPTVCVEPDRGKAITAALCGARPQDVVLIAGKGHEDYQIVGTDRLHFSDVEVARAAARLNGLAVSAVREEQLTS